MPLEIVRNDITRMDVDAIVNAANETLLGGGGVDGAIHAAAGPELLEECRGLGGCATGDAKITRGYRLPARWVIHTVGPVWRGGWHGEKGLLSSCYRRSLELALEHGCESVAFPLISSGAYGYPKAQALQVAVDAISAFLLDHDMTVYIVVFGREELELSGKLFARVRSYIDDVYVDEHIDKSRRAPRFLNRMPTRSAPPPPMADMGAMPKMAWEEDTLAPAAAPSASLDDMLDQIDESFSQMLLRKIDEKRITDAACYKRANIDRRLFNKIKNNPSYRPGKQTVLAFAIALELDLDETKDMLMKAGFALSHSSKSDIVVEYCILHGIYNIIEINEVLFKLDLEPLGY